MAEEEVVVTEEQGVPEEENTASESVMAEEEVVLPSDEGKEEEVPAEVEDETSPDEEETESAPQSLIQEYTAKVEANGGEITEEMYAELAAKGYDKDTVDTLKAGIEAKQEAQAAQILSDAGTNQGEFKEAVEWAKDNWSPERIARFNSAVESNSGESLTAVIEGLMDTFNAAGGPKVEEPVHSGVANPSPSTRGYSDMDEMIKDMGDPRYKDIYSSYHKAVKAKAAKSKF